MTTKLKEVLEERKIKGIELARGCDINVSIIYSIISGKQYVWPEYRKRISAYLNMDESELFD